MSLSLETLSGSFSLILRVFHSHEPENFLAFSSESVTETNNFSQTGSYPHLPSTFWPPVSTPAPALLFASFTFLVEGSSLLVTSLCSPVWMAYRD